MKDKPILKYMLDRYLGWFAVIYFIGLPVIRACEALNAYFFAWRLWRYLWFVGLLTWTGTGDLCRTPHRFADNAL